MKHIYDGPFLLKVTSASIWLNHRNVIRNKTSIIKTVILTDIESDISILEKSTKVPLQKQQIQCKQII